MIRAIASCALGLAAMSLSGCDGGKEEAPPSAGKAEGEILPRSVTDDMLPYDTVRSQPPLADPEDEDASGKPTGDSGGTAASKPGSSESPDGAAPLQPRPDAE